jgi:GNAT superfamily N-acetyltransferase
VAEYDGKIIATGDAVVWQKPAMYGEVESGKLGNLLNFYTVPKARTKGVGTQLLNELIKETRSLGLNTCIFTRLKTESTFTENQGFLNTGSWN